MDRKTPKKYDKYKTDYNRAAYDRIGIYVPKGERENIQEHAKKCNVSTNIYILQAIQEKMIRDDLKTDNAEQ